MLPLHHGPLRPAEESNLHGLKEPTRTLPLDSSLAPCRSASRTSERMVQVPAISLVLFWQHWTTRPQGTCSRGDSPLHPILRDRHGHEPIILDRGGVVSVRLPGLSATRLAPGRVALWSEDFPQRPQGSPSAAHGLLD